MPRVIEFSSKLKEIRIHLCQHSDASKGVRDFIEKFYVPIKKINPKFPILIRECKGIKPALWARYEFGNEKCVGLSGLDSEGVFNEVKKVSSP